MTHDNFADVFILIAECGRVHEDGAFVKAVTISRWLSSDNLTDKTWFIDSLGRACFDCIDRCVESIRDIGIVGVWIVVIIMVAVVVMWLHGEFMNVSIARSRELAVMSDVFNAFTEGSFRRGVRKLEVVGKSAKH